MKKKVFIIIWIISSLIISVTLFYKTIDYNRIKGDSGFDTSYDSENSSWSNEYDNNKYDNYSYSSHNYSSSYSNSYSSKTIAKNFFLGPFAMIATMIVLGFPMLFFKNSRKIYLLVLFSVIAMSLIVSFTVFCFEKSIFLGIGSILLLILLFYIVGSYFDERKFISKLEYNYEKEAEVLKKYNLNYEIKHYIKNNYIEVQNAWMNFNYDKLRTLLTDELYNQYEMQLKSLERKKQKNIMKKFKIIKIVIKSVKAENKVLTINTESMIKFKDYIVDEKGKCVRGSKYKKVIMHYKMVHVMAKDKPKDINCPNCGAPISDLASQRCSNCNSVIARIPRKIVLAKKQALSQK